MNALNTTLFVCLLAWLWMFADCVLCRARLTPLLGSQRIAISFWTLMALAVNPILVVLYALFGRSTWSRTWKPWIRQGVVFGVAAISITLQFGMLGGPPAAVDVKAHPLPILDGLALRASRLEQSFTISTRTGVGQLQPPRTIRVLYAEGELAYLCARQVAKELADVHWTESVELWPCEHSPQNGALAPDLYVNITAPPERIWPTPLVKQYKGTVNFSVASVPFPMGAYQSTDGLPQMGRKEITGDIHFDYLDLGFSLGGQVYAPPAQQVGQEIHRRIVEAFGEAIEKQGDRGQLPGALLPEEPIALPQALLDLEPEFRGWEYAPFVHSRAYYEFYDERPYPEVLAELSTALADDGWGRALSIDLARDERAFTTRPAGAMLAVGNWPQPASIGVVISNGVRLPGPPLPPTTAPFVITLESRFDSADYERLAQQYLRDPVNLSGLRAIRRKLSTEQTVSEVDALLGNLAE